MKDELDIEQLIEEIRTENERMLQEWIHEIRKQLNQNRR